MFIYLALLRYHEYLFIYSFYWPTSGNLVWKWNTQSQITLKLSAWLDITQGGRGNIENCIFFLVIWLTESLTLVIWSCVEVLFDSGARVWVTAVLWYSAAPLCMNKGKTRGWWKYSNFLLLSFYSLIQFDRIQPAHTGIHDSNEQIT